MSELWSLALMKNELQFVVQCNTFHFVVWTYSTNQHRKFVRQPDEQYISYLDIVFIIGPSMATEGNLSFLYIEH